jgi:hypothetical protein
MGEEFYTINLKELGKESPEAGMGPDVIQVPAKGFSGYSMETWSQDEGRRVFHEGGWYIFKGTEDGMDILDKIPAAVLRAEQEAAQAEEDKRVQEKGHKCWDFVQHDFDPKSRLGDYYYCTVCDEVLQVG